MLKATALGINPSPTCTGFIKFLFSDQTDRPAVGGQARMKLHEISATEHRRGGVYSLPKRTKKANNIYRRQ